MRILADEMAPRIPHSHSNIDSPVTDHSHSSRTKSSCAFPVFRADCSSDSGRIWVPNPKEEMRVSTPARVLCKMASHSQQGVYMIYCTGTDLFVPSWSPSVICTVVVAAAAAAAAVAAGAVCIFVSVPF